LNVEVKVENIKKLQEQLRKYASKSEAKARKAVIKTAYDIHSEAVRHCPVSPHGGRLRSSIAVEVGKGASAVIGTNVKYAKCVEFGTKPHIIRVKNAKVLTDGKTFFGKEVHHPGTKPQPFLRPAFITQVANLGKYLKEEFSR